MFAYEKFFSGEIIRCQLFTVPPIRKSPDYAAEREFGFETLYDVYNNTPPTRHLVQC